MDKDEIDLSKICWNKYEDIHNQKVLYIQKIYTVFDRLKNYLSDFENKYNLLDIDAIINPIIDDQFNDLIKYINKSFKTLFDSNSTLIQHVLNEFKDINNIIKKENIPYEKVVLEHKKYKEKKEKVEKLKNNCDEKLKNIENSIVDKLLQKKKKISIDTKKMNQVIKEFTEYKNNLDELNKYREEFIKNQKILLEDYYKVIIINEAKLFEFIKKKFYLSQQNISDFTSTIIEKYKNKKRESQKEIKENEIKYFKEAINKFKCSDNPEEKEKIFEYFLKHKPYSDDPNCKPEDIAQAKQLSEDIIKIFRKTIRENYPESGLQIQEAIIEIPEIFQHFFKFRIEISEQLKEEMFRLLKEDIRLYPQILIELGKVRADGKIFSSKTYIEFITALLLEILKIAEQKIDFKAAKECLLLSQTFFIIDEKTHKKIYSFEKIKNYKWLRTSNFWRNFINDSINKEFRKFEFNNDLNVMLKDNPEISEKIKKKVKDLLFALLVPYLNNMKELNIDKRIILKLLYENIEKYKYLDNVTIKGLENLISDSQEEIEKFKKEIKENKNLENEIEAQIEKDNDNINNDINNKIDEVEKNEIIINEEIKKDE